MSGTIRHTAEVPTSCRNRSLAALTILALLLATTASPAFGEAPSPAAMPTGIAAIQQESQESQEAEETGLRAIAVKMGQEGLVPPTLVERVTAEYTPAARRARVEGDVYIEAVVNAEGTVVEPKLIRGIGDEGLDQAALAAIVQWRFEPGTKDGDPVPVIALFTVTFRIE